MKCKHCGHDVHPDGSCRAIIDVSIHPQDHTLCGCKTSEPQTFDVPLCPNCHEPIRYSFSVGQVAETVPIMMGMLWCGLCGHLFAAQMLGALQPPKPMIQSAGPSGPLKL